MPLDSVRIEHVLNGPASACCLLRVGDPVEAPVETLRVLPVLAWDRCLPPLHRPRDPATAPQATRPQRCVRVRVARVVQTLEVNEHRHLCDGASAGPSVEAGIGDDRVAPPHASPPRPILPPSAERYCQIFVLIFALVKHLGRDDTSKHASRLTVTTDASCRYMYALNPLLSG